MVLAVAVLIIAAIAGAKSAKSGSTITSPPKNTGSTIAATPTTAAIPAACHEAIADAERIAQIASRTTRTSAELTAAVESFKVAKAGCE